MKLSKKYVSPLLTSLTVSLFFTGCAAPGSPGSSGFAGMDECNPAVVAGIGAVLGGMLGGGTNTVRGAAIGASLGALSCVALNYHSEQVKSSQQVQNDYKAANKGRLPQQTMLVKYQLNSPPSIRPGQTAQTSSYIEVAAGSSDPNPLLEEELTLFKPNGEVIKSVRKTVANSSNGGGFRNSFSIPMPEGVPQGVYPIKTTLYLNNRRVAAQDANLQIVQNNATAMTLTRMAAAN